MQVLVDRQGARVVGALRQADGVAAGHVAVLLAGIELVLLLVEAVHQVARAAAGLARALEHAVGREVRRVRAGRVGRLDVVVDLERQVGEVALERGVRAVGAQRRRREVDVVLQQALVRRAVLVDLDRVGAIGLGHPVHALPAPVEVVEGVVLLVDDDDPLDLSERRDWSTGFVAACAAGAMSSAAARAAPRVMRFTEFLPGSDGVMAGVLLLRAPGARYRAEKCQITHAGGRYSVAGVDAAPSLHPVAEVLRRRHAEGSRPGARTDPHRVVLAVEGGGARGAVSGGMAQALDELGLVEAFDGFYGSSAGALNAVWLLSPDPMVGLSTWTDETFARAYANVRNPIRRRRPFIDVRALIEELYETRAPLDWQAVLDHPVTLHPLATDVATGDAVDLAGLITDKRSLQLALRATCTIPLLGGKPVALGRGPLPRRRAGGVDPVPRGADRRGDARARAPLAPLDRRRPPGGAHVRDHVVVAQAPRRADPRRLPLALGPSRRGRRASSTATRPTTTASRRCSRSARPTPPRASGAWSRISTRSPRACAPDTRRRSPRSPVGSWRAAHAPI